MADHDHMAEAEPNWFDQASSQLSDLWSTLDEIGDPTLLEAWDAFEGKLNAAISAANTQRED